MADFPFSIVGFDLDGTLFDTAADLAAAVNHALGEAGRPTLSVEQVRAMMGGGGRHMFAQALAATGGESTEFDRLYRVMVDDYLANIAVLTRPYPGAVEAIDALAVRGVKVALVTNKLETLADRLLRELGLREWFKCLIGGDSFDPPELKPSPAPLKAMIARLGGGAAAYVGDTQYDVLAARNAGIPSVIVRFGHEEDAVGDAVIDHFDQLVPTLERIGHAVA